MFDTIVHERDTQFITREVHEHRAPTDASVVLLKEMQEKTLANILTSKLSYADAGLDAQITVEAQPWNMDGPVVHISYWLETGGEKKKHTCHVTSFAWKHRNNWQTVADNVVKELSEDMARGLLYGLRIALVPFFNRVSLG
jgi:hypothetical protein